MKMRDVAVHIRIDEAIQASKVVESSRQSPSTNRAEEIAAYLLSQSHRFLNAWLVGVYGGNPKWNELEIKSTFSYAENSATYFFRTQGILTLSGDEIVFAIDGKKRIAGIQLALRQAPGMADEEVPVIFLAGVPQKHKDDDPVGFERTRQLFSALNSG
jgi:DNA sulfur modification protein DndB